MDIDSNNGASDIGNLNQQDESSQHKDKFTTALDDEGVALNREKLVAAREDAANIREKAIDLRENVADSREDATNLREGITNLREQKVSAAETVKAAYDDQIVKLQQVNAHLVVATMEAHKLTEQVEATKVQLKHLAHHDVLTGLPNRLLLQDRHIQAIELASRQNKQLAVMFLDLDQFKHINDSLGHAVGDKLLQSVAQRLLGCVRHSDTISRQGGDEFVVLLPFIENLEGAVLCAQKMLAELALPHLIDQYKLHIGVSIGISIYPDDGQDPETQLKNADIAMFHAKASGRNNYKFFKQDMNDRAVQRQSIEASLRRALERQEFVLHYQPKINLKSGVIVGVEALIRWQHPEQGLLSPAQFIAIAEDCGLIRPIGRWVLREACLQARSWQQAGLPSIIVAVNVSALEFRAKDFLDNIRQVLKETGLEPSYLELEVTESVLMQDVGSSDSILHALANLGVMLAIDDFGTGYSSLSYLRKSPINTLKIDQSFVSQICSNPDDAAIVSAVINMGQSLKLRIIAEGVESSEQASFLLAQRCDEGQGYYFGRPMVAEAFATLLQTGVTFIPN